MFARKHHQLIASVLENMDAALLNASHCFFAGGTVLAMRHNEYRESKDIDFMVCDTQGYRHLRLLLTGQDGFGALAKTGGALHPVGEIKADQYGIRGKVEVAGVSIKIEIVREARIQFDAPHRSDQICGITTLSAVDLAAEKLLANSDRWLDAAIFSRDVIDLAMMEPNRTQVQQALQKAEVAYGASIKQDLEKSIDLVLNKQGWLDRCMDAMAVGVPKALLLQRLTQLARLAGVTCRIEPKNSTKS